MDFEYKDGRILVDEAVFTPVGVHFRVGQDCYRVLGVPGQVPPSPEKLRKVKFIPVTGIPFQGYAYAMEGLYPRTGYDQFIRPMGRAATQEEIDGLREEYNLGVDDVSLPFEETHRGCFGAPKECEKKYMAIQIAVTPGSEAIKLEERLRTVGIEAFNGSAGRVTIRIA